MGKTLKFKKSDLKNIIESVNGKSKITEDFFDNTELRDKPAMDNKPTPSGSHLDYMLSEAIEDINFAGKRIVTAHKMINDDAKKAELKNVAVNLHKAIKTLETFYGTTSQPHPNEE